MNGMILLHLGFISLKVGNRMKIQLYEIHYLAYTIEFELIHGSTNEHEVMNMVHNYYKSIGRSVRLLKFKKYLLTGDLERWEPSDTVETPFKTG